jgi:hypothetical protein
MSEYSHADNLKAARKGHRLKNSLNKAKGAAQELSLFKYIRPEDFIFVGFAIILALLKDILDFVGVGSLPAIGTVITLVVSIFIAAFMYLVGANKNMRSQVKASSFMMRRILTWLGCTLGEMVFGVDFLPIETIMVLALYRLVLLERKEESQAKQQENSAAAYAY